jgi:Tfp pilus assembly PilM family ATPase
MRSSYYLGISFYKGQIQLAELDHGKKTTVSVLSERSTAIDFTRDNNFSADHPQLFTFIYELEELIKQNKVHSKTISFALPTESLYIQVVPVDATLQGADLTSHLHWEFEQFFPNVPVKDFIVSSYPIPTADEKRKHVILVGVRRGLVAFLKRAATELRLQVHLVDVDHFSAEKTIRHCHPEILKETFLLLGARGDGLDASLIFRGNYVDYRGFAMKQSDDLKNNIIAYRQYLEEKIGSQPPTKALLYGYGISQETLQPLQRETGINPVLLDAVRNMTTSKHVYEEYIKDSSRFAAAVGLALRTQ